MLCKQAYGPARLDYESEDITFMAPNHRFSGLARCLSTALPSARFQTKRYKTLALHRRILHINY